MSVYLLATLDTKGREAAFVRDALSAMEVSVCLVDTGCQGEPQVAADISREELFRLGGTTLQEMRQQADRGLAISQAARGAAALILDRHSRGEVQGVLGIGGSAGTTIGTAAMRALPLGVPKVMVSTLASGQVRPYVGDKDILMLNSVVDILGLNRISRPILHEAARAMAGLVRFPAPAPVAADRPLIAATMFGVTTPCVMHAREILESAGYEVLVFHATGNGGRAMESLIDDGLISGVLDITTTELADELVGGTLSAGPDRLTAAGRRGIPQVISVGAMDMVNFGPMETVPERFRERKFHRHNANVTLMRTTPAENFTLGEWIGRKASAATGPTAIVFPTAGVSAIDCEGQSFNDPVARAQLLSGIQSTAGAVEIHRREQQINDPLFAEFAAKKLLDFLK